VRHLAPTAWRTRSPHRHSPPNGSLISGAGNGSAWTEASATGKMQELVTGIVVLPQTVSAHSVRGPPGHVRYRDEQTTDGRQAPTGTLAYFCGALPPGGAFCCLFGADGAAAVHRGMEVRRHLPDAGPRAHPLPRHRAIGDYPAFQARLPPDRQADRHHPGPHSAE